METMLDTKLVNPVSLACCVSTLIEVYCSLWFVVQSTIFCMWKIWTVCKSAKPEIPITELGRECRNTNEKQPQELAMMVPKPIGDNKNVTAKSFNKNVNAKSTCSHKNSDDENAEHGELSRDEVATVMRKLGTSYDPDADKLQERLGTSDIATLFEEHEPSLEELQEAFGVFDENNDGFIDAKELRKVLCRLCFTEASEGDCKRMIRAYDDNGDGLIDFYEFARLLLNSFE